MVRHLSHTKQMEEMNAPFRTPQNLHCVYFHELDGSVIWVGHCPIVEVFRAPDAHDNNVWCELMRGRQNDLVTRIVATDVNWSDDLKPVWLRYYMKYKTRANFEGQSIKYSRGYIMCVADGFKYRTQAQCAEFYGIAQSALSAHLAGKPGHKTINGKIFIRVTQ